MSTPVRSSGQAASDPREDALQIAGLIRIIDRALNHKVQSDIARSGLTGPQVRVIEVLFDAGPLSLKDLSARVQLSHSTVSGIVDRLERRQLLRRQPDPADRRISRIGVTEQVAKYGRSAPRRLFSPLIAALGDVSVADRTRIIATLKRLAGLVGAD